MNKTNHILISVFSLFILISCDLDIVKAPEKIEETTQCFTVLDKDTDEPIEGVTISLWGPRDCTKDCKEIFIGTGTTDINGNACIQIQYKLIRISLFKTGYSSESIQYPDSELKILYLENLIDFKGLV